MGSRGVYKQSGGFTEQTYKMIGNIDRIKVISGISKHTSLPQMSNTPSTSFILVGSKGEYKSLGIYGEDRRLKISIDITHGLINRFKSGKTIKLKRGVAHVHYHKGGRQNNVQYMSKKIQKKYGKVITKMGGKINE